MARAGITFDEVAAAADGLLSEGQQPTIKSIRERLGTGSPNTIHKHLLKWRESQPVRGGDRSSWQLPEAVAKAIYWEIERAAAEAKAEIEQRLVQAQAEAADLAELGEALEAERDAFAEQNATLTKERDVLSGKAEQQELEILELRTKLSAAEAQAEAARIELAKEQLRREGLVAGEAERKQELENLRGELHTLQQAKIAAEQQAAVLQERVKALQESAKREADHLTKAAEAATAAAEAADRRAEKTSDQLRQVQAELDRARQAEAEAKEKLAGLKGQVEAVDKAKEMKPKRQPRQPQDEM